MNATGRLYVSRVRDAEPRTHNSVTAWTIFDRRKDPFRGSTAYCWFATIAAGEANEAHVHEDIEKIYYVLQGSATVVCGEDMAHVQDGEAFFFPAQVRHSITNTGTQELQMLVYASSVLDGGNS